MRRVEESIIAGGYTGRVLRGQPGAVGQVARRLRGPHLHRPAVQQQPQLRSLLGRDQGEAGVWGRHGSTKASMTGYRDFVKSNGGCNCKKYFGVE